MNDDTGDRYRQATAVFRSTVVALAVVLLAAACGSSGSAAPPTTRATALHPQHGGSMVVGVAAETGGWNPTRSEWTDVGSLVGSSVLEPLAAQGADSGAQPWLARSWIANATFDSWLISLQSGVTFQDGEPFDAAAVKLNLDAYVDGPVTGLLLKPIIKDVVVVDSLSVRIDLNQPWAALPTSFLDSGATFMMAPKMLAAPDNGVSHPIGTGPFTFASWEPNAFFRANRNPTYWGGLDTKGKRRSGLPYLDSIEFRVIPDDGTRAAALQDGDVNMLLTTDATAANSMQSSYTVVKDWSTSEDAFVLPNTAPVVDGQPNPLHDIHARRALAYATNSRVIVALIGAGVQAPTSPWSPDNPWGMPDAANGYGHDDLAKAKAEVAQYEKDTGRSSLVITLLGQPSSNEQRLLQLLQSQWKRAGITTNIQTIGATAYLTKVVLGDFEAAFSHNYGFPDPDSNFPFWSSNTAKGPGNVSINVSQYASTRIDADLRTGRESGYPKIRKAAYDDLVRQLNAAVTNIWLYHTPYSLIAQHSVQGLEDADGPAHIAFGNYQPKTWLATLWIQH